MEDSSLSAYELSRLQRIKENQELVRDTRFEIAVHCIYLSAPTTVSRGNETLRLSTINCQLLLKSVCWAWFYYLLLLLLLLGKYTYRIISKKEIQLL